MIKRGFTLIELLIVITLIALASAGVVLAMRDGDQTALEREAQRLASLLDAARAQAVATGQVVVWQANTDPNTNGMRWRGLPKGHNFPTQWLNSDTSALPRELVLSPEPITSPQRVSLTLSTDVGRSGSAANTRMVFSDGVGGFVVLQDAPSSNTAKLGEGRLP